MFSDIGEHGGAGAAAGDRRGAPAERRPRACHRDPRRPYPPHGGDQPDWRSAMAPVEGGVGW
eukprot:711140-Prorocentrum_minimum.AAC.1